MDEGNPTSLGTITAPEHSKSFLGELFACFTEWIPNIQQEVDFIDFYVKQKQQDQAKVHITHLNQLLSRLYSATPFHPAPASSSEVTAEMMMDVSCHAEEMQELWELSREQFVSYGSVNPQKSFANTSLSFDPFFSDAFSSVYEFWKGEVLLLFGKYSRKFSLSEPVDVLLCDDLDVLSRLITINQNCAKIATELALLPTEDLIQFCCDSLYHAAFFFCIF